MAIQRSRRPPIEAPIERLATLVASLELVKEIPLTAIALLASPISSMPVGVMSASPKAELATGNRSARNAAAGLRLE